MGIPDIHLHFTSAPTVCTTSLCRDLEYLLKIPYSIQDHHNVAEFLILLGYFFGQVDNTALCLKKYRKNEWHLCLVAHIFTKHSQNVCLINTHILICQHGRCDCKLWNALLFWVFSCSSDGHLYVNCCISSKLSLILCLISILVCRHDIHDI